MTNGVQLYSTTAAENVQANTGVNWDEGMAPAAVNNSARQNMADLRAAFDDLIWFQYGSGSKAPAPVYSSGTIFTQASALDLSAAYHVGRRVKAVGVGTGTIYGSISATSYAASTQTVTVVWDSGSLSNEALTIYLSQIPVTGTPTPAAKTISSNATGVSVSGASLVPITSISVPPGNWRLSGSWASGTVAACTWAQGCIGTTSGSSSGTTLGKSSMFFAYDGTGGAGGVAIPPFDITQNATTTYYLNGTVSAVGVNGSGHISAQKIL